MADIDWAVFGPQIATLFAAFLAAERSRSGLSDAEIFERAGVKHDANITKLLEDLERLKGDEQE